MSRTRSLVAAVSTAVLLVAAAGCGSDDKSDSGKALSASEFKKEADKICGDFKDKVDALDPGKSASEGDVADAVKKVADALSDEADEIGDLNPPKSIADDVEAMLSSLRDGAKKLRDNADDITKLTEDPLADASKKAKELDLEECGS